MEMLPTGVTPEQAAAMKEAGIYFTTPLSWGYEVEPGYTDFMVDAPALWKAHNNTEFGQEIPATFANGEVWLHNIGTEAHFAPGDVEAAKAACIYIYQNN